jgi:4-carboxymuconolactone decarboxylase
MPKSARLKTPRIKPVPEGQWTAEQRELIKPMTANGPPANLYTTMLNHPKLYGPRRTFGSYIQRESLLPPKTRELIIMRTAWLIRSEYEWAHHVPLSREAGLTDAEIARIAKGPQAAGWSEEHAAVLQAVDELRREAFITNATWSRLVKHYDMKRLVEIIYTSGGYTMTGLAINSFGIQVEPGYPSFPSS